MSWEELLKKVNNIKGLILSIAAILGMSFGLHTWLSSNFVTKEHFDNTVNEKIQSNMNEQFLVLQKTINETKYNVLGPQVASIKVDDVTDLSPIEITYITQTVREYCMLGKTLGYMAETINCEDVVTKKLTGQ